MQKKNDIKIVGTYIDRAMSAKTDNRPDFQRMIKESGKGLFDLIIVWELDRFARNRYDSAHYKSMVRKNGVKVISATEAISEGAEGILLESLLEGMAEYYSVELAEKTLRGMTENVLACKSNDGILPIAYTSDEELHYKVDPIMAPIVVEAFNMYAEGSTMKDIARKFNARGIRTKRGTEISINTITSMLHNRKYIGEYQFKDVVIPNGVPAIVSQELFDRVQERMAANKKAPAKHKAEDEYLGVNVLAADIDEFLCAKIFYKKLTEWLAGVVIAFSRLVAPLVAVMLVAVELANQIVIQILFAVLHWFSSFLRDLENALSAKQKLDCGDIFCK